MHLTTLTPCDLAEWVQERLLDVYRCVCACVRVCVCVCVCVKKERKIRMRC